MSRLTDLLRQARQVDPQLGADLEKEVAALTKRRTFGLVFERHQPEAVELPGRPIRRGDKVRVLPPRGETKPGDHRLWRVERLVERADGGRVAHLREIDVEEPESQVVPAEDLVVVAEFKDRIFPGLVETGRLETGGSASPNHTVINAENFHALEMLTYTHRQRVDVIYIDPPYNTGNADWVYNDRHVSGDDLYRHSKWLAFMERRLRLARDLLRDTGVLIVAIGDDEQHRLRMLLDQVFHESNFISNVVWQGGRKNDSRYVSNGADYMLIYAKSEEALREAGIRWRVSKPGVQEALQAARRIWEEAHGDDQEATRRWRSWLKDFKAGGHASDAVTRFTSLGPEGRPMRTDRDLRSPNPRPNLQYDLLHPKTGKPVKMHPNGWRYSRETMTRLVAEGRVKFGPDENSGAGGIDYLDEQVDQVPSSVFERDRNPSGIRLREILGERRFPNPKDVDVLGHWIGAVAGSQACVLDFFGGSGSTLEAVLRLNHADGGRRQCVLVTNNEVGAREERTLRKSGHRKGDAEWEARGVFEYVTRPRITTVLTGVRPDGATFSDTVPGNVVFMELTYESPLAVRHHRAFERVAPMLWMRAGSQGRMITDLGEDGWDVSEVYAVLENLDQLGEFVCAVEDQETVETVFVVTDDDAAFQLAVRDLPDRVTSVRLYSSYLENFALNTGGDF